MARASGRYPVDIDGFTTRQRDFIDAYLGDANANAAEAARMAGYSGDAATLGSMGGENLRKPLIRNEILRRRDEAAKVYVLTLAERRKILTNIAKDKDARNSDKVAALKVLCQIDGNLSERRIHEGRIEHTFAERRERLREMLGDRETLAAAELLAQRTAIAYNEQYGTKPKSTESKDGDGVN